MIQCQTCVLWSIQHSSGNVDKWCSMLSSNPRIIIKKKTTIILSRCGSLRDWSNGSFVTVHGLLYMWINKTVKGPGLLPRWLNNIIVRGHGLLSRCSNYHGVWSLVYLMTVHCYWGCFLLYWWFNKWVVAGCIFGYLMTIHCNLRDVWPVDCCGTV